MSAEVALPPVIAEAMNALGDDNRAEAMEVLVGKRGDGYRVSAEDVAWVFGCSASTVKLYRRNLDRVGV